MMVRVLRSSDPQFWYAKYIGEEFGVIRRWKDEYVVREPEGYLNIIKIKDTI